MAVGDASAQPGRRGIPRSRRSCRSRRTRRAHDWRFRIAYRLSRKKQLAEAELVEFKPNDRLVCRTSGGDLAAGGWLLETYALSEDEDTTLLTHTVDLANSRMPYFSRVAVVFLTWLFNSSGDLGHVRNLKALIEDGVPPPVN